MKLYSVIYALLIGISAKSVVCGIENTAFDALQNAIVTNNIEKVKVLWNKDGAAIVKLDKKHEELIEFAKAQCLHREWECKQPENNCKVLGTIVTYAVGVWNVTSSAAWYSGRTTDTMNVYEQWHMYANLFALPVLVLTPWLLSTPTLPEKKTALKNALEIIRIIDSEGKFSVINEKE